MSGASCPLNGFQSTLSVRRATRTQAPTARHNVISIHALRKESDIPAVIIWLSVMISIHALRKESDRQGILHYSVTIDFNPRSP